MAEVSVAREQNVIPIGQVKNSLGKVVGVGPQIQNGSIRNVAQLADFAVPRSMQRYNNPMDMRDVGMGSNRKSYQMESGNVLHIAEGTGTGDNAGRKYAHIRVRSSDGRILSEEKVYNERYALDAIKGAIKKYGKRR